MKESEMRLTSKLVPLAVVVTVMIFSGYAQAAPTYSLSSFGTWLEAEAEAVIAGGHLVAIKDATEQALMESMFGTSAHLWIGLNDVASEGTFVWTSPHRSPIDA